MPAAPAASAAHVPASSARWKGVFVGVLVLVATLLCSAVLHFRAMAALKHEVQDKLLRTARTLAAEIDGDAHRVFIHRDQQSTAAYELALQPLRRALYWREEGREVRNDYRFIYTCVLVGDEVRFVLDPTPPDLRTTEGVSEKSYIMQPYPDASEMLLATLHTGRPHADSQPYTDQWGTFVSGYAPFFDSSGALVGALGVDWRAETYAARLAGIRQAWYLQIILCLASGFISGVGTGVAMVRRERAEAARRHAVEEAERTRRRWRIMVETLPKPAAHLEGDELWVNDALARLLGHPHDALATPAAWFERLFGPLAAEARAAHETARAEGYGRSREMVVRHADGRALRLDFIAHAYAPGEVWLVEDVTERREYEARLVQAREAAEAAAQAKGAFLATVSHEIRTPMNGVIGMTHLLLDSPLDARQQEMVETIRASGETLVVLINDILDYSKIESGGMELESAPFELRAAIDDCLQLFAGRAAEKGLHLVADLHPACPAAIRGDTNRFRQILSNLVSNAVKFTPSGEVVVRVAPDPAPAENASPLAPGTPVTLRIDVRDTGIGIPSDRADRLFKSFSQVDSSMARRYGGTGLGLAIARRLAELMGGSLTLAATSAAGSTFRFTLATEAVAANHTDVHAPRPALRELPVLLVEPHPATAAVIAASLRRWGLDCTTVADATQALRHLADFGPFRLLIADLQLPGIDGLTLCRRLADLPAQRRPRAILLTPLLREEIAAEARALGVHQLLQKPVRPASLLTAIETLFEAHSSAPFVPAPPPPPPHPLRILVAEDNPVNRLVIRRLLERHGYEPEFVADGQAALDAVQATPFDLVFMDVQMPVMNGYEATRRIRALPESVRQPWIIALTANALEGDRETALAHGMDDYLAKPLRPAELERALRALPVPPPRTGA